MLTVSNSIIISTSGIYINDIAMPTASGGLGYINKLDYGAGVGGKTESQEGKSRAE